MGSLAVRQRLLEDHIESKLVSDKLYEDLLASNQEILKQLSQLSNDFKEFKNSALITKINNSEVVKSESKQRESMPFIPSLNDIDMKTSVSDPVVKIRESNIQDSLKKLSDIEKNG